MPISSNAFVRSTTLFLLAGAIALIAIVGASVWLGQRTQQNADAILAVREMRAAFGDLRTNVQELETGQRGYLLTNDEQYLAPYSAARDRILPALQKARQLAAAYPAMDAPLQDLSGIIDGKRKELDATVAMQKQGRGTDALAIVRSNEGKVLMDHARAGFNVLFAQADQRLNELSDELRASALALRWVTIVAAIVILLMAGGSVWTVVNYTKDLATSRNEVDLLNASLEVRVRERTQDLRRANEEIQRFAYIVTHDLRAPLVNIMGFTSELEASLPPIHRLIERVEKEGDPELTREAKAVAVEDLPEAIGFIKTSTRKMDALINAILKLSRAGQRPLKPEVIELNSLLRSSTEAIQHQIAEASGAIDWDIHSPPLVSDRLSLEQVFGNLFDNAIKYRDQTRPLRLRVKASAAQHNRILIEVADNGRGIQEQDHERIFELFRRSGSQDQTGEGIGLAHVRSAIRNLGGDITLESMLGQGTTFFITLPRDLAAVIRSTAA